MSEIDAEGILVFISNTIYFIFVVRTFIFCVAQKTGSCCINADIDSIATNLLLLSTITIPCQEVYNCYSTNQMHNRFFPTTDIHIFCVTVMTVLRRMIPLLASPFGFLAIWLKLLVPQYSLHRGKDGFGSCSKTKHPVFFPSIL